MLGNARTVVLALFIIFIACVVGGCWSSKEIDEIAFIVAMAIDKAPGEDGLYITFRVANPSALVGGEAGGTVGGAQGQETSLAVGIQAESIPEALDTLRSQVPRRPFLSHMQGLFIGEELAKEGLAVVIDFLERHPEVRRTTEVIITRDSSAAEYFTAVQPKLVTPSGIAVGGVLEQVSESGHAPVITLGEFSDAMGNSRKSALATTVKLTAPVDPFDKQRSPEDAAPTEGRYEGTALFQGDRLVGYLDGHESRSLLMVRNELVRSSVALAEYDAVARIARSRSSIRLDSPDPLRFTIAIDVLARMQQLRVEQHKKIEEVVPELEQLLEKKLEADIARLVERVQSLGSDVIELGRVLYQSNPRLWKEVEPYWFDDAFPRARVNVLVNARIIETGHITRSMRVPRTSLTPDQ